MKTVSQLLKAVEHQLKICTRCGMCQAVCPLFAQTGHESDVARGKLALLESLALEMFKDPKGVYDRLNRCLLCGSCAKNCPSRVRVLEIFIKARLILGSLIGLSYHKRLLLRHLLARPKLFNLVLKYIPKVQNLFIRPVNPDLGTSTGRLFMPLLKHRHFIPPASISFSRQERPTGPDLNQSDIKAAFFTGCLIDRFFPRVAKAAMDVLAYHHIGLFIPKHQGCCGMPALSSGDGRSFNELVRYHLNLFETHDFNHLITCCATCAFTIKVLWPVMFQDDDAGYKQKVNIMADKTMDIHRFLTDTVGMKTIKSTGSTRTAVTYHDPCHLSKSLGVFQSPRSVINHSGAYYVKEMKDPDQCCGFGGNFNLQNYDLSSAVGKQKVDNIIASGCSTAATGCPACMMHISDMLSRSGSVIKVVHPVELYALSLKNALNKD